MKRTEARLPAKMDAETGSDSVLEEIATTIPSPYIVTFSTIRQVLLPFEVANLVGFFTIRAASSM